VPLSAQPQLAPGYPLDSPNHWWVRIMARLESGANDAQAQASLAVLFPETLQRSTTTMDRPNIRLEDGSRGPLMIRQRFARPMWALLAGIGLVLLIVCANLASLQLARGAGRQHELAVRAAIGASRWRLMRQSLTESLMLALTGGSLGWVLAYWGKAGLMRSLSNQLGDLSFDTRMDFNVLVFTLGISVLTAVLFGMFPALRFAQVYPAAGLRDPRGLGTSRLRLGKALVSVQLVLSVVMVMGASLIIQTFANLRLADPGFDVENLLLFRLDPEDAGYKQQHIAEFFETTGQALSAIPGVRAVAWSNIVLIGGRYSGNTVSLPGAPVGGTEHLQAAQLIVSDAFFSTLGLPVVLGREFNSGDSPQSPNVAIVNETFAREAFAGESPVGRVFILGEAEYMIVGVCRDARFNDLRSGSPPTTYLSHRQTPVGAMYFQLRSALPPLSLVPAVRKVLAGVDRNLPIADLKTQQQQIELSMTPERIIASLCGFLALLAVLLSCIGIYGLMAYRAARRTGEIGIRMALGARPWDVARSVLREALMLAVAGLALGVPLAFALAQVNRSFLVGIQPHDPSTLIGGIVLMTCVALLAAWIPARRAARVDPMAALRSE
jgi:predicted permease